MDKEKLEREHSAKMNQEAVERIKREHDTVTVEESEHQSSVLFEDDAEIKLRDGKTYIVPPLNLKGARQLMQKLRTVNVDVIILNFLPSGDDELDKKREDDLFDILLLAFKHYKHVDRDYIDEYVDLETARKIIDILIGLNGLKK